MFLPEHYTHSATATAIWLRCRADWVQVTTQVLSQSQTPQTQPRTQCTTADFVASTQIHN